MPTDILKISGWETNHVMKTVYRHSMADKGEQAKGALRKNFNLPYFFNFHDNFMTKNDENIYFLCKIYISKYDHKRPQTLDFYL